MGLIVKLLRNAKIPRWSTLVPVLFYLAFISCVLMLAFPASSPTIPAEAAARKTNQGTGDDIGLLDTDGIYNVDESATQELTDAFNK